MFRKSSRCRWDSPQCCEVAILPGVVITRDSTDRHLWLSCTPAAWAAFVASVKNGTFGEVHGP